MKKNTRKVIVTVEYSDTDSIHVAYTDETLGPVVTGATKDEVIAEMNKALKVHGAMVSFINAINLYNEEKLGPESLSGTVTHYIAEAEAA